MSDVKAQARPAPASDHCHAIAWIEAAGVAEIDLEAFPGQCLFTIDLAFDRDVCPDVSAR